MVINNSPMVSYRNADLGKTVFMDKKGEQRSNIYPYVKTTTCRKFGCSMELQTPKKLEDM